MATPINIPFGDWDEFEVDGVTYEWTLEDDPDIGGMSYVNDWNVSLGRVAHGGFNHLTGRKCRPAGFDGGAMVLHHDGSAWVWWQPWSGYHNLPLPERDRLRTWMSDLVEYGPSVLLVRCPETGDGCGICSIDYNWAHAHDLDDAAKAHLISLRDEQVAEILFMAEMELERKYMQIMMTGVLK